VQKQTHWAAAVSHREITKRSQMIKENQGFLGSSVPNRAAEIAKTNPPRGTAERCPEAAEGPQAAPISVAESAKTNPLVAIRTFLM
jgi:hypothetical protein